MTMSDAKAFCLAEGGALARAKDGDQWLQMLQAAGPNSPNLIRIDGRREAGEDVFMCSNKESKPGFPCRFLPWAFGEPNDADEACIGMAGDAFTYILRDGRCSLEMAVMCRFRL